MNTLEVRLRNPKLYLMLLADAALTVVSLCAACAIRFDFAVPPNYLRQTGPLICLAIPARTVCLIALGLYRGMWRYTGLRDAVRLVGAAVLGSLAMWAALAWLHRFDDMPRGVFVLDCILFFLLAGGLRLGIRLAFLHRSGRLLLLQINWFGKRTS